MARVWYCAACGYEVQSKGRCHNCGQKLVASALPELEPLDEDDEVGYRLDGWAESDRGRLIVALNGLGVLHRFEEEELVVEAGDEARVDDLVASLADGIADDLDGSLGEPDEEGSSGYAGGADGDGWDGDAGADAGGASAAAGYAGHLSPEMAEAVSLLASAAGRLHKDPTDMQADGDLAEASATVFLIDDYGPLGEDEWSAVGRVTRKLLSLLGAEEALEEGIRDQAAILEKLLVPITAGEPQIAGAGGVRTVYELPEWLPEQRAQLGVLLDQAGVDYSWDGDELLVPSDREDDAEALFGGVDGIEAEDDEDAEARYAAVAELFAAAGRLSGDPSDPDRQAAVVEWFEQADGPPLLGMDDVDWHRIIARAKSLVGCIAEDDDHGRIHQEADDLHQLLRAVV